MEVLIVGTGPAALKCAEVLAPVHSVTVLEKKKGPGRKFLIAGSSGLNITYDAPNETFHEHYQASDSEFFKNIFKKYSKDDWLAFVQSLGIEIFCGTSRRYFVKEMKAAPLLRAWIEKLSNKGVNFKYSCELTDFNKVGQRIDVQLRDGSKMTADALVLALGGASYEKQPVTFLNLFKSKQIQITDFTASNVGLHVVWKEKFLQEAEGKPLKNVVLKTERGERQGELVVTKYGLEGTPVYSIGAIGEATLDLLPDLTLEAIIAKLKSSKENLSPMRRMQKMLSLSEASQALVFHHSREKIDTIENLAAVLKKFKIVFTEKRSIEDAISSAGGVCLNELDSNLMLKKIPGVFVAGEILDFDTTTGGFLIQAAVSTGHVAGLGVIEHLSGRNLATK